MELLDHIPSEIDAVTTRMAVYRYDLGRGEHFGAHDHPQHQLSWTRSGLLVAEVGGMQWQLPPTLALWIPADVCHDVSAVRSALLYNLKFNPARCGVAWPTPTVVSASTLFGALIEHLADHGLTDAERRRAERVLVDQLIPVDAHSMSIPLPRDPRALRIARALIADPTDGRSLTEWGGVVGASERTLVRLFADQTGLTFSAWRSQTRVRAALILLEADESISSAALRVGYRDVSAFIDTFRRSMGTTPGAYVRSRSATPGRRR